MGSSVSFDSENFGKLFIRTFFGVFFIATGIHFFTHGHGNLIAIGAIVKWLKIGLPPMFLCETLAVVNIIFGLTVIIGFLFRMSCFVLALASLLETVASMLANHGAFNVSAPTLAIAMAMLGFVFIGSGKFAVKN
jgi:uncharacterized membrane protein YphA (DoxX/SURF4 family)